MALRASSILDSQYFTTAKKDGPAARSQSTIGANSKRYKAVRRASIPTKKSRLPSSNHKQ